MSEPLPTRREALTFLAKAGCSKSVVEHCKAVSAFATKIAQAYKKRKCDIDVQLVEISALLHDIGRSRTHTVDHASVGGEIVRSLGLPNSVASIIERHAGGGIPKKEARKLGWPTKDYLPQTLEEKIVCYADKRIEGLRIVSIEQTIKAYAAALGNNHPTIERIWQLHREISTILEDLNANSDTS